MPPLHRAFAPDHGPCRRRGRNAAPAWGALLVAAVGLPILGCNRGPARSALAEADEALTAARPALERYLPAELARLEGERAEARARLAEGRYTDALRIAQRLPGRVAIAASQAEARRVELGPLWKQLGGSVRLGLETLAGRLAELASSRRWPRGFAGEAALAAARAELASAHDLWQRSQAASDSDPLRAVDLAREAQGKLDALAASLTPGARAAAGLPTATVPQPAATTPTATKAAATAAAATPAAAGPAAPPPPPEPDPSAPASDRPAPASDAPAQPPTPTTTLAAEPPPPLQGER